MKRTVLVLLLALLATTALSGNAGSAYTMFGIGDLVYYPSVRSAGMGFTGIGLPAATYINSLSPAAWSRINRVRIEAIGLYEGIGSSDASASLYQARGLFNGVHLALPISQAKGIVFAAGFAPYSRIRYNTSFLGTQGNIEYRLNEIGSGGLTRGQVGLSYAPLEDLAIGASVNYLFGKTSTQRVFTPTSSNHFGGTSFVEAENRGTNFTFSTLFTGLGRLSDALRPFSLGFVLTTQASVTEDVTNRMEYLLEADTLILGARKLTIPVSWGVGAAYQLSDRWLFAADYFTQKWDGARLENQPLVNIRTNHRFGFGVEKLPLRDATSWWDKLAYRLGFSYEATYYRVNGEPINQWSVTGGLTMPVFGDTRFNIGVEYAQRGVHQGVLVRDRIIRVAFSLMFSELWFVSYEEE